MKKYIVPEDCTGIIRPVEELYGFPGIRFRYSEQLVLLRVLTRYLRDHPDGESAEEARHIHSKILSAIK